MKIPFKLYNLRQNRVQIQVQHPKQPQEKGLSNFRIKNLEGHRIKD